MSPEKPFPISLIAIDLDGTLVGPSWNYFLCQEFRDRIAAMCPPGGARWGICTGRKYRGFRDMLRPLKGMGVRPHFLITRDAYLCTGTGRRGYIPHLRWNLHMLIRTAKHNGMMRLAFAEWREFLNSWDFNITRSSCGNSRMVFKFASIRDAERTQEALKPRVTPYPMARVRLFGDMLYLDYEMFNKGMAVREMARLFGTGPEGMLAIGDGYNDVSMMKPEVARFTGCPRNARPEVVLLVHEFGGHIARQTSLAGVIEVLDAYRQGTLNSSLPDDWVPPGPPGIRESTVRPGVVQQRMMVAVLAIAILMAVLAILVASLFGMVPWLSGPVQRLFGR